MDKVIVALFSIGGIGFTYWYFLMKKDDAAVAVTSDSIDILVDGGYSPSTISVVKGKPVTLRYFRKDPSSCLDEVVLADFKIRKHLALNQTTEITVTPDKKGTFDISCGMNMFHGKIIVT